MASTYSAIKIELIGTGEQQGTWGDTTNLNLGTALEEAIVGRATANFTSDANLTLTLTDTNATQVARHLVLNVTSGVSLTVTRDLIVPAIEKPYIIQNNTTGAQSIRVIVAGTGVTVPNGKTAIVYNNGTDVGTALDFIPSLTLGAALPVTSGGTGVTTSTGTGNVVLSTSPTLVTPVLGTPQSGTLTNATGLPLSTGVTGTLAVANGGTGLATLTANNVVVGNGTSAPLFVAPGTSGNVLTSNGTTWASTAAGSSLTGITESASPFETSLGTGAGAVTTGVNNTFIGFEAGNDNTTGANNTAVGFKALDACTTSTANVAVGSNALGSVVGGNGGSTAVGNSALAVFNPPGNAINHALGNSVLAACTTGAGNVGVGNNMGSLTTGGVNTAVGSGDGVGNHSNPLGSLTTGSENIAIGASTLTSVTTTGRNIAIGVRALGSCVGGNNVAVGSVGGAIGLSVLNSCTTGGGNVGLGSETLGTLTTGSNNVAIAPTAGLRATTADNIIAIGANSLNNVTTGGTNIGIGLNAGNSLTTGVGNTVLGQNAQAASATTNNSITLGSGDIASLRCQITTISSLSDRRDKKDIKSLAVGLSLINAVRPVSFIWNMRDGCKVDIPEIGFIAQELLEAQQVVGLSVPGLVSQENPERLEAAPGALLPILIKAVQELSAQVTALQVEVNTLKGQP